MVLLVCSMYSVIARLDFPSSSLIVEQLQNTPATLKLVFISIYDTG